MVKTAFAANFVSDDSINDMTAQIALLNNTLGTDDQIAKSVKTATVLGNMKTALRDFTVSSFWDSALRGLQNIGAFFNGLFGGDNESPLDKMLKISQNADKLEIGARSLGEISKALSQFSKLKDMDLGEINFKGLAEKLGESLPLLEALATGEAEVPGTIYGYNKLTFNKGRGILDPSLRLDELAAAVQKVNYVLGRTTEAPMSLQPGARLESSAGSLDALQSDINTAVKAGQSNGGGGILDQSFTQFAPTTNNTTNLNAGGAKGTGDGRARTEKQQFFGAGTRN